MTFRIPRLPIWAWTLGGILTILMFNAAITLPTYTTTKREFCLTCHHQQREPSFWEESTIHPKINCSECHATGHALMPSINIFPLNTESEHAGFSAKLDQINPNCIRCHPRVFEVERASPKINPYKISIPHRIHVQQLKNSCTSCHYNVYHDPHDPPTFRPPKEACFECHRREKTSCTTCHPKSALPLPTTTEVSHSECSKCHRGFEDAKIKIYDLPFPHRKHIARILDCNTCHASGQEHGKILKKRVECLGCHHQTASNCTQCHEAQARFIQGKSLGERQAIPDVMAEGVKCIECHQTISLRHSLSEVKKTCVKCHEVRYGEMTDAWQKAVSGQTLELKRALDEIRKRAERRKPDSSIKGVEDIIKVIEEDGSKGVHNFVYAERLFTEAQKRVSVMRNPVSIHAE